ncbi:hypothetical protein MUK42_33459 [Musa troglodytarum]|uniref:Uncharacterized protein n=1 Tax=Musa troglodytarum TaxID=320322 RepID=A0A9E7KRX9_9LILI|nr:hypothetical protein MUK42_33459 [Musa troglodytarum]
MIQVTDAFDVSADDDNDGEPSHFIAAQQQRDAAKKIHGPTGTPPATKLFSLCIVAPPSRGGAVLNIDFASGDAKNDEKEDEQQHQSQGGLSK